MASITNIELRVNNGVRPVCDHQLSAAYPESTYLELEVVTGTVDGAVSFGGVTTADMVYVESDQNISFKLSGGSDSIAVDANKFSLLYGTSATSLTISNSSGSTANVIFFVAG